MMRGSRHTIRRKPTGMSLAQFSRTLTLSEVHSGPDRAGGTREIIRPEGVERFAANVVAAMSNPAPDTAEEVAEPPKAAVANS